MLKYFSLRIFSYIPLFTMPLILSLIECYLICASNILDGCLVLLWVGIQADITHCTWLLCTSASYHVTQLPAFTCLSWWDIFEESRSVISQHTTQLGLSRYSCMISKNAEEMQASTPSKAVASAWSHWC